MKKVILFALVLAVCGVFHNSVLAQEDQRYLVTYVKSSTSTAIRSLSAVTVINQSADVCRVQIEWFNHPAADDPPTRVCNSVADVNPGSARQFCSRSPGANGLLTCNIPCIPGLGVALTGPFQGIAIVSSSAPASPGCSLIGVDARVYYTTGAGDTAVSAISNSKVVFIGEGNLGD